jgi:DNA polymerase/3'-5' exonuclease PolX
MSQANILPVIIDELDVMRKEMLREKNVFKARAYNNVITQLKELDRQGKIVHGFEDLQGISGIGDRIHAKIQEIIDTGKLAVAEKIKGKPETKFSEELMNIYGIGPVKAKSLIADKNLNLKSIVDLRKAVSESPILLNDKQKIGLRHYEDLLLRIPRSEMEEHETYIKNHFNFVNSHFKVTVVGSYRRKAASSGDIDVLVTLPSNVPLKTATNLFAEAITKLKTNMYITDVLALGDKKCMAVCRLSKHKARRLDILLTPPSEYPYAMLYFTGSDKFNIQFRRKTLEKGYSLSEHGLKKVDDSVADPPEMKTEKDIFDFFKIPYVQPEYR